MTTSNELILLPIVKRLRALGEQVAAVAKQEGPQGPVGPAGRAGADGASGAAGRDGAPGIDGRPGPAGPAGARGPRGADGAKGDTGADGKVGPMPRHEWRGTKLRFQLTPQTWGPFVDLKGPRGAAGASGGGGGSSNSGITLDDIEQVSLLLPGDELLLMRNGELVRVHIQTSGSPANAVTVNGEFVMVNGEYVTTGN